MQFSPPGFLDKDLGKVLVMNFKIFLTVQDNLRSYQGFQDILPWNRITDCILFELHITSNQKYRNLKLLIPSILMA